MERGSTVGYLGGGGGRGARDGHGRCLDKPINVTVTQAAHV